VVVAPTPTGLTGVGVAGVATIVNNVGLLHRLVPAAFEALIYQ
jgi:hypothetical protein